MDAATRRVQRNEKDDAEAISRIEAIEELMHARRPIHGGVMSRERIEKVWDTLQVDHALKIEDLVEKTGLNKPTVQKALYILLGEGRAVRSPASMDRNVGRPIFEYVKVNIPTVESIEDRQRRVSEEEVVRLVPKYRKDAATVSEIAKQLDTSDNTARMKLSIAVARGVVIATKGVNDRNQVVTKYYRYE